MVLQIGKIYKGRYHKQPHKFIGLSGHSEVHKGALYQFEVVFQIDERLGGYGQTREQVIKEEYKLDRNLTILYGK